MERHPTENETDDIASFSPRNQHGISTGVSGLALTLTGLARIDAREAHGWFGGLRRVEGVVWWDVRSGGSCSWRSLASRSAARGRPTLYLRGRFGP